MDWLNSALSDSEEDDDQNENKDKLNDKNNDKLNKFVEDAVPFPKVLQTTETITKTVKKQPKSDENQTKELKTSSSSNTGEFVEEKSNLSDSSKTNRDKDDENKEELTNKDNSPNKDETKKTKNLFSIETKVRKVEKFDQVKIKPQELSESDLKELSQLKSNESDLRSSLLSKHRPLTQSSNEYVQSNSQEDTDSLDKNQPEYEEKLDYNEAMESFNKSNVNFDKLLKSNQWLGPKIKIKDVKQDDLLQSNIEKDRNYTVDRSILYEGSKKFTMPTRLMETDDGQVITTNVARRTQKRKHQINWLAMEAQEKEMDIMERTAHMRKSKRETRMKYGW